MLRGSARQGARGRAFSDSWILEFLEFLPRQIDGAAASLRAALACDLLLVGPEEVVYGQFLAFPDGANTEVQNVALEDPRFQVRIAAMIDELGAAAANRAIHRPIV